MTLDDMRAAVDPEWQAHLADNPRRHFVRAGRTLGHRDLPEAPGWTASQAGRAVALSLLTPEQVAEVYQQGDAGEKLAVLKALPLLDLGDEAVQVLHDALRTNDTRLVGAALGPYAGHLDEATWRQGVIKCVFMGVPLAVVDRLDERADAELAAMLTALADERAAAGRAMPDDAVALLNRMKENR
jgi:hypothetical protein